MHSPVVHANHLAMSKLRGGLGRSLGHLSTCLAMTGMARRCTVTVTVLTESRVGAGPPIQQPPLRREKR